MKKFYLLLLFEIFISTILGKNEIQDSNNKINVGENYLEKNFYLIDSLSFYNPSEADLKLIDSCIQIFHQSKNDTNSIKIIEYVIENCWNDNIWPKYNQWLYEFTLEKLELNNSSVTTLFLENSLANTLNSIGYAYYMNGNKKNAIKHFLMALELEEKNKNMEGMANSINNIASIYENNGEATKAYEYYKKSLDIYKRIDNKLGISNALNNLGFLYVNRGNIPKALSYYHESLKIKEEINDENGIAISLNNLAMVYNKQNDVANGLKYYNQALSLFEKLGKKKVNGCLYE